MQFAVVLEPDIDASFETGLADPRRGELVLRRRDRRGRYAASIVLCRVHREAAPAGADLEEVIALVQFERVAYAIELGACGFFERHIGPVKDQARVGHRLVEEELEELVAQVVVILDVAPTAAARVAPERVTYARKSSADTGQASGRSGARLIRAHERAKDFGQVRAAPMTVEKGARRAELALRQHALVEAPVVHIHASGDGTQCTESFGRPEALRAERILDRELGALHAREATRDERARTAREQSEALALSAASAGLGEYGAGHEAILPESFCARRSESPSRSWLCSARARGWG
jgi:hypothetical protein